MQCPNCGIQHTDNSAEEKICIICEVHKEG